MSGFAVIRHPDAGVGVCPAEAMDQHRANGWMRVSEYRAEPSDFHLSDFADATDDLDAEAPEVEWVENPSEPEPVRPAKKTKETEA